MEVKCLKKLPSSKIPSSLNQNLLVRGRFKETAAGLYWHLGLLSKI